MKNKVLFVTSIVMLIVTLITTILVAFLLVELDKNASVQVGEVKVSYEVYFTKESITQEASEVLIDPISGLKKSGVYFVNMDNSSAVDFIENINVDILVESSVDTYIRIKIYEQHTLKVKNYLGEITEISILNPPTDFEIYSDENITWQYYDGYYYCLTPVKGILNDDTYDVNRIKFIIPFSEGYNPSPPNYSLQIGIEIDAVQALDGPEKNWGIQLPLQGGN